MSLMIQFTPNHSIPIKIDEYIYIYSHSLLQCCQLLQIFVKMCIRGKRLLQILIKCTLYTLVQIRLGKNPATLFYNI